MACGSLSRLLMAATIRFAMMGQRGRENYRTRRQTRITPASISERSRNTKLPFRSQAPPGNALSARLRLAEPCWIGLLSGRQSLPGSAFPGGAWERAHEVAIVTRGLRYATG